MRLKRFEVQKIERGELIEKDGVYEIDVADYHGDCCIGPSISSTGLRTIDLDCPAAYWADSPLNKQRVVDIEAEEKTEAKHFRIGRAAHTLLLEPGEYAKQIAVPPVFRTKSGEISTSFATAEAKEWVAKVQREGKTILQPKEERIVHGVCASLRSHPLHGDGIFHGEIERAIVWKDPKTGVWLKARPDNIPASAAMLTDLKVMASAHPDSVRNAIRGFGYDMQLALGGIGCQHVIGLEIEDYAIVAAGVKPPHLVHVQTIGQTAIFYAQLRLRRAIDTFARCLADNYWPGYDDRTGEEYNPSDWDLKKWKEQQDAGYLPKEW